MIKIQFNNDKETFYDIGFNRAGHVVTLNGITEQNTSGFTTWRMDGITQLGDFSAFTTVYRVLDKAVQYSDDGSVWVEPEYSEPVPPTDEKQLEIDELKQQVAALSAALLDL